MTSRSPADADGRHQAFARCGKAERDQTERTGEIIGAVIGYHGQSSGEEAIRRSEASLAEAQKLKSHGQLRVEAGQRRDWWSEETYRIFEYDSALTATVDSVVQPCIPSERALVHRSRSRRLRRDDIENE